MPNLDQVVVFGRCPRCSRTGIEDDEALNGYELIEYQGQFLCQLCIAELQDQYVDGIRNEHEARQERFRSAIGMTKS